MQPLPDDPISHIIDRAPLGVINAFARSRKHWAGYVRTNALDYADMRIQYRMPLGGTDDDPSAFIDRLPNGKPHGELITIAVGNCQLVVTYRFGEAISWVMVKPLVHLRGHRDTPYTLMSDSRDTRNSHSMVYSVDRVPRRIDTRGDGERRPLRGYIVDGALAPSVINAWMGEIRADPGMRPPVVVSDKELRDTLTATALFDVRMA